MATEQLSTFSSGRRAASLRQAEISGGVVAKITSAPSPAALSITASTSSPGSRLYTLTLTLSARAFSIVRRPWSWAAIHALCSGSCWFTNATFR